MIDGDEGMRESFLEAGGQCELAPYGRSITIENNEDGRFKRLIKELEGIAKEYGVPSDQEFFTLFESVSCSKKHLKLALEKKTYK